MVESKHVANPIRILLGGGIGSGKSAAGRELEQLGATLVEADLVGHTVLEPDGEAFAEVAAHWPSVVIAGRIDRPTLGRIVFADPEQLTELETVTHPAIIRHILEIASAPGDLVIEVPLILDIRGTWTRVFIDVEEPERVRRIVGRGGTVEDAVRRIANQPKRDEWIGWADRVIDNNGSLAALDAQVDALWRDLQMRREQTS